MKALKIALPVVLILCVTFAIVAWQFFSEWRDEQHDLHTNPYRVDGLVIKWYSGGVTPSYPSIQVWVMHKGSKIEPDIFFSGLEDPDLYFRDYDGDGRKDVVFEDRGKVKAVAFFPASGSKAPRFVTLRDDPTSG